MFYIFHCVLILISSFFDVLIRSLFNNLRRKIAEKDTLTAPCRRKIGKPAMACKTAIGAGRKSIAFPAWLRRQEKRR